jgi:hypothetical protein
MEHGKLIAAVTVAGAADAPKYVQEVRAGKHELRADEHTRSAAQTPGRRRSRTSCPGSAHARRSRCGCMPSGRAGASVR